MCVPCCDLSGRYITSDGELDPIRLRKVREKALKEAKRRYGRYEMLGWYIAKFERPFTDDRPPCLCECHQDGKTVLH